MDQSGFDKFRYSTACIIHTHTHTNTHTHTHTHTQVYIYMEINRLVYVEKKQTNKQTHASRKNSLSSCKLLHIRAISLHPISLQPRFIFSSIVCSNEIRFLPQISPFTQHSDCLPLTSIFNKDLYSTKPRVYSIVL